MLLIFCLLILSSCSFKQGLDLSDVKKALQGPECLEKIKHNMDQIGCTEIAYRNLGENDIIFRCHKPKEERGDFWDNYIFRVSLAGISYSPKDQKLIEEHTLCIEDGVRIEAYPPKKD